MNKPNGEESRVPDKGWPPLDWRLLDESEPPKRRWAIKHWIPMGHVTLLAGSAGSGKTLVSQAMASCIALQRDYLDYVPDRLKVLMWACEDDAEELWRRQRAIAAGLNVRLADFADELTLYSYDGRLVELAGIVDHQLVATPMLTVLREQIVHYKADVVFLDNSARLYGGDENDRHQVTSFIAMLTGAARVRNAAIVLLAHPSKNLNSEYSGSTAWEGAVRTRLYLGRTLPDKKSANGEDLDEDDTVRYLCRRKANYSARDFRRLQFVNGVLVPDPAPEYRRSGVANSPEFAQEVITRGLRSLTAMEEVAVASTGSKNFLPKMLQRYHLDEGVTTRALFEAMIEMQKTGLLVKGKVGTYGSRNTRVGLMLKVEESEEAKRISGGA